ncbi:cysteine desulfurase [Congregibacter sp.]|uniref:cysteine desulfurase n=1 Tax=Congregibacter sp. TaxID=2744308 RepID=UPI003F6BA822
MSTLKAVTTPGFDVARVRADFPILKEMINGQPLVYLDNAATTQKPDAVIDAIANYYRHDNANVHRGVHTLSDRATRHFEDAREKVSGFLNSPSSRQVIWTRGTTEAINLVAYSWGMNNLKAGDRVLVSWLEHHSDIVPWQLAAERVGADVVPIPVTPDAEIDLDAFDALLDERVKLVAVNHVSNAMGTINPVEDICARARAIGALTLIDGAQAVGHWDVDVQALGCDFYCFSGHKLFAPTGVGVLWGREDLLEAMPPFLGGGEMIDTVSFDGTTFNTLPFKFEAGTPNIAGAVGLGAAIDYLCTIERSAAAEHENALLAATLEAAREIPGLRRIGAPRQSVGIFSFLMDGCHPSDVGMLLDEQGIAVRTGHHCTQPLMNHFELPGTVRASFSMYNNQDDVDRLIAGLKKAQSLFGPR